MNRRRSLGAIAALPVAAGAADAPLVEETRTIDAFSIVGRSLEPGAAAAGAASGVRSGVTSGALASAAVAGARRVRWRAGGEGAACGRAERVLEGMWVSGQGRNCSRWACRRRRPARGRDQRRRRQIARAPSSTPEPIIAASLA